MGSVFFASKGQKWYNRTMKRTNEYVKVPNGTMFFPKVYLTKEEITNMYVYGHVRPSWFKLVLVDDSELDEIIALNKPLRASKSEAYNQLIALSNARYDEMRVDLERFANGSLDLMDLSVKYWTYFKDTRKLFKDVLIDVDVDAFWKQHKKHSQKETTMRLYGVEHTTQLESNQELRKQTTRQKYGVDNVMQLDSIKQKQKDAMLAKYGVDHNFKLCDNVQSWNKHVYETLKEEWQEVFVQLGVMSAQDIASVLNLKRRSFVLYGDDESALISLLEAWAKIKGESIVYPTNSMFQMNITFSGPWLTLYSKRGLVSVPDAFLNQSASRYEQMVANYLDELGVDYVANHRKLLNGLELDFYIPSKNLAIEVNPNVTHNSNRYATNPERTCYGHVQEASYHYNKYKSASAKGITLIHLYGYDLDPVIFNTRTKTRIKQLVSGYSVRLFARNTVIKKATKQADKKRARDFLNEYHVQGASRASVYYLVYNDSNLVAVASFDMNNRNFESELKRLCVKPDVQIVGLTSKIIARFFKDYDVEELYSYSDNNLGNGLSYQKAGGVLVKETGPALLFSSWTDPTDVYSWQIATPWGAREGLLSNYGQFDSQEDIDRFVETELSHRTDDKKGYDRIYTAGSKLWLFTR